MQRLVSKLEIYAGMTVLAYDAKAHAVFQELQAQKLRVGTQDLKIAAIVFANDATLLTRNTQDFSRIPNLNFADWTV